VNRRLRELREVLAQSLVVGLAGPEPEPGELELFGRHGLGGAILFARNVQSPPQIWRLNRALARAARRAGRPPLFIMVDQEGGSVARLKEPFTHGPDFRELGERPPAELQAHGARLGRELAAAGFNWDLAPVLDVHAIPQGVMARRSLGSDPRRVAELGAAFIQGLQGQGVLACAKHFPGLGRTTLDTHRQRPVVELGRDELEALELVPFREAAARGVAGVMVCHAVFTCLDGENPASLSPAVVEGLLRGELGYGGLVLSDDLEMGAVTAGLSPDQAAVAAYRAGCDLLLICQRAELALAALERLVELAAADGIPAGRIQAGARRIREAKVRLAAEPPPLSHLEKVLGEKG